MEIKREKIEAGVERKIAIGMVVSRRFLREVSHIFDPELLTVPYIRTLGRWCLDHWERYGRAPKHKIREVYDAALRRGKVPDSERDLIEDFLENLSEEWERDGFNVDFWLDEAERYLDGQKLLLIAEDAQAFISQGNVDEAREALEGYRAVRRPSGGAVNPLDGEVIEGAFEDPEESLFTLPGAAGQLLNPMLTRGALVGIMAPEKRGKTHLLTELAIHAVKAGKRVAFFSVGDMTTDQMTRRIGAKLARRPIREPRYAEEKHIPIYDCLWNQKGTCDKGRRVGSGRIENGGDEAVPWKEHFEAYLDGHDHVPCDECRKEPGGGWRGARWWAPYDSRRLTVGKAKRAAGKFLKVYGDRLRLFEYGTGELNVKGIRAELTRLKEREDFLADVVISDYADNFGPEDPRVWEERHKQNMAWGAMSAGRKEWNNCWITATQADAQSYAGDDITMSNFTEDKRKLGHVTGMLAINQTAEEKKQGLARLGVVVAREMDFHVDRQVVVMQHLATGRALLGSYRR
jgi:hypothetical protein